MISYEQLKNIDPESLAFEKNLIIQMHVIENKILNAFAKGDKEVYIPVVANRDTILETLEDLGYNVNEIDYLYLCIVF